ncbi:hypothetical protein T484DRAFT_1800162, partial [Baffinella frigidus]
GPCSKCSPGDWCWGGTSNACPEKSDSLPGAWRLGNCTCTAGFAGGASGKGFVPCSECGAGSWCLAGEKTVCPANSTSPEGSGSRDACQCLSGFSGDASSCHPCPPGSFKPSLSDDASSSGRIS